jgi:amidase
MNTPQPAASPRTTSAFADDILGRHDAVGLAELVRAGEVHPRELVDAAIARCEVVEPHLNAVVTESFDQARRNADQAATTGAFAGVPTFIKDMTNVAGLPTLQGSEGCLATPAATSTAAVAQQLFDMGMICLGKSSLPEFGFTPSAEFPEAPPTHNPWNHNHTAGGSSGGAGALVASGVVPLAHGQDGGGSVRIPAACNGLVGLKPSRGRIIATDEAPLPVNIVSNGVLTRTVRDTATYYAEAEHLHHNQKLPPVGHVTTPIDRPLRIGAIADSPASGASPTDEPTRRVFTSTVELLESLGHHVEPMASPVDERFRDDFVHYWAGLAYGLTKGGTRLVHKSFDASATTNFTRGLSQQFRRDIRRTPGTIRRLRRSTAAFADALAHYDVMLSPTVTSLPTELGFLGMDLPYDQLLPRVVQWVGFTPLANATGTPSLSLPMGLDGPTNLPVGMMFGAAPGSEALLLQLGLQLETARPFPQLANS